MIIKPYGDTLNDGSIQLSFTLPVANNAQGQEAAKQLVLKLGFDSCEVVDSQNLSDDFTMFVAYGKTSKSIDLDTIKVEVATEEYLSFDEINAFIKAKIGRKVVIVGGCTGSDAHTVGIDAIMNMKGYNHHYGLERYTMIEAYNLGAQVPNETMIEFAKNKNADAIIISQVVTQKDVHIKNLTEMVELLEAENLRDRFILVAGGPRISHKLALELGYDAGFGRGTYAEHVATHIIKTMENRKK
ncbi:MAG: OAM dimerization domain-containing protein [Alphaproteobacteria bacterium]